MWSTLGAILSAALAKLLETFLQRKQDSAEEAGAAKARLEDRAIDDAAIRRAADQARAADDRVRDAPGAVGGRNADGVPNPLPDDGFRRD